MAADLTVVAVPLYFGSMEVERRVLRARAEREGPSAAVYTPDDTRASLAMGVGSLVIPLASHLLLRHLAPGTGRYGRVLVRTAVGAAVVTTVADRLAGPEPPDVETEPEDRAPLRWWARRVRRVSGPIAIGSGVLAASAWMTSRTNAARMWEQGERHDRGGGPVAWTAAIVGWDFVYYWNHRMMHEVRLLWAHHVVHHSSERYNLSTALRQPVADVFGVYLPYGLMARVGIRPALIAQARGINLLYQYWIHTDTIRSIGRGEEVLNTPSHHRVHHGSNGRYLDRNHGSILIIWDRLFGTFQREEEPVVYGLTKNIDTYNPVRIATHEFADIVRDVARSATWRDRLSFVFRGPGWAQRSGKTRRTLVQR